MHQDRILREQEEAFKKNKNKNHSFYQPRKILKGFIVRSIYDVISCIFLVHAQ